MPIPEKSLHLAARIAPEATVAFTLAGRTGKPREGEYRLGDGILSLLNLSRVADRMYTVPERKVLGYIPADFVGSVVLSDRSFVQLWDDSSLMIAHADLSLTASKYPIDDTETIESVLTADDQAATQRLEDGSLAITVQGMSFLCNNVLGSWSFRERLSNHSLLAPDI